MAQEGKSARIQEESRQLNGDGIECGPNILKLASSDAEKRAVLKLRYQIFNEELQEGLKENEATGLDRDEFDDYCDHLMILHKNEVIGTYRLLPSSQKPKKGFYTQSEFQIDALPIDFSLAVELGRGCISPEFRKQSTLMSLFWGFDRYLRIKNSRFLFGCASLPLMGKDDAEATFEALKNDEKLHFFDGVEPLLANKFQGNAAKGSPQVPPLMKLYLQFGAKIVGRPAYDPAFGCYDMLMLVDRQALTEWGVELLKRFDKRLKR